MPEAYTLTHWLDDAFHLPEQPHSRWHRAGLSERAERFFDFGAAVVLLLLTVGWAWAIVEQRLRGEVTDEGTTQVTSSIATALTNTDAPSTAYLTDAALKVFTPLRGASGKLRVKFASPGETVVDSALPSGATVTYTAGTHAESTATAAAPRQTGIWDLAVRVGQALKPISDFHVITMVPISAKRGGRVGLYYIGSWPTEGNRNPRPGYAAPSGFIEVTPENQNTYVSEHFRLRDFLTHDQQGVWPKYLVLRTPLVDKLELVLEDLEAHGISAKGVHIMSGFRSPQYNVGGGDPRGRATLSRHMYGDASDIYIDNDGDGRMDDLNHDGKVDIRDAQVIQDAVDRVDREHPELIGGCGIYPATSAHGPFTHIDTRGYRARWIGTGDG